ncbi:MAG: hypothetical protein KDJ52_36350 [Anaerolineae bacterium]|nr:hypothetical protein [Anaerolineae bacterium]
MRLRSTQDYTAAPKTPRRMNPYFVQVEALPSDAASFNSGLYGGSEDSAPYESLLRWTA